MSRSQSPQELLRERMERLKWNQTALSRELNVSSSVVSRWLSGERHPNVEMACRIRDVLGIPIEAWRQAS